MTTQENADISMKDATGKPFKPVKSLTDRLDMSLDDVIALSGPVKAGGKKRGGQSASQGPGGRRILHKDDRHSRGGLSRRPQPYPERPELYEAFFGSQGRKRSAVLRRDDNGATFDHRYAPAGPRRRRRPHTREVIDEEEAAFEPSEEALSEDQFTFTHQPIRRQPNFVAPFRSTRRPSASAEGRHLRITGLDYSILVSDLEELFLSVGPVEKCWINFDRTDRSLGTGGVIFCSPADAQAALELFDGRMIDGQPIQLELVLPRRYR